MILQKIAAEYGFRDVRELIAVSIKTIAVCVVAITAVIGFMAVVS